MEFLKRNWQRIALILFIFVVSFGRYQYKMPKRGYADFHVYYYTAKRLIAKKNIYDADKYRKDKVANFKYPPLAALIFLPLGYFPEKTAAFLWFSLNFLLLVLCFYYSGFLIFDKETSRRRRSLIYFLAAIFSLRFILYNFDEGQVNILMFFSLLAALVFWKKKKTAFSALALAFSSLVKYMSLIFLPLLILKKRKVVYWFLLFLVALSLLPSVFLGWDYNLHLQKQFFPFLCQSSLDFNSLSTHENQSLLAALVRFFSAFSPYQVNFANLSKFYLGFLSGVLYAFFYLLAFVPARNSFSHDNLDYTFLFVFMALFNPNGWVHGFIYLLFPLIFLFYYLLEKNPKDIIGWAFLFLFLAFSTWPNQLFLAGKDSTEIYSLLTFASLFLLGALAKVKFQKQNFRRTR